MEKILLLDSMHMDSMNMVPLPKKFDQSKTESILM